MRWAAGHSVEVVMALNLNHIGQIALPVLDVDRAETFYENVIGLR